MIKPINTQIFIFLYQRIISRKIFKPSRHENRARVLAILLCKNRTSYLLTNATSNCPDFSFSSSFLTVSLDILVVRLDCLSPGVAISLAGDHFLRQASIGDVSAEEIEK